MEQVDVLYTETRKIRNKKTLVPFTEGSTGLVNALCTNTDGSFTCQCNPGYVADGFSCVGMQFQI